MIEIKTRIKILSWREIGTRVGRAGTRSPQPTVAPHDGAALGRARAVYGWVPARRLYRDEFRGAGGQSPAYCEASRSLAVRTWDDRQVVDVVKGAVLSPTGTCASSLTAAEAVGLAK